MGAGGPLSGIRVVTLADNVPGPFAAMLLADLGADVIMVERLGVGDTSRQIPGLFMAVNRNKRSIAVDTRQQSGRDVVAELARNADVFIEGLRPGSADRLGFGYSALSDLAPQLVYASISGFGQTGPYRLRRGHDISFYGVAGMLPAMDQGALTPGEPGIVPWAGMISALFAVIGITTALHGRAVSGRGTHVDISMTDTLVAVMGPTLVAAWNDIVGMPPPPPGYGAFETADGRGITLSVSFEDHLWNDMCEVLDLGDLKGLIYVDRRAREEEVRQRIAKAVSARTYSELETVLDQVGVPFGPVNDLSEVRNDVHIEGRNLAVPVEDESGASTWYVRQPLMFNGDQGSVRRPPPRLGEQTIEILEEHGFSPADIEDLLALNAIASSNAAVPDPEH